MKQNKRKIEIIAIIVILLLLAVVVGVNRIDTSNFNPTNGDFQNYNPVRRFLSGQIPYKDFAVYLGTGHLVVLSAIQLLVGNNFTSSLLVSNMVTMLCFELTVFVISYLVLKNKKKALYITLLIAVINIMQPQFLELLNRNFIGALDFGIRPGNSARLLRNAIMVIVVLLALIGAKFLNKTKNEFLSKNKKIIGKIGIAIVAGGALLWSNDGGIATYISLSFIYFLLLIKEYKKNIKEIVKYTAMYIGISMVSFILLLTIVTRGNIFSWFEFSFGVSSYQKWYYGEATEKKNISLFDIDTSIFNMILIGTTIYYLYKLLKEKKEENIMSYAGLSMIAIASILSAYLYQFLSGGRSRDMLNLMVLVLMISYTFMIFDRMKKEIVINHILKSGMIIVAIATILTNVGQQITDRRQRDKDENAVYIPELGGYFTELGDSIQEAVDRIGTEKVFSTYASAVETATSQFQPTGADYIIHCLGDEQREKYIENFKQGDFKYVSTLDKDGIEYRYWIRNANWFFYRELYKDYKPVFTTEYSVFFEKKEEETKSNETNKIEIEAIRKDDTTYILKATAQNKNYNGIADVKIAYDSKFISRRDRLFALDINRYVYVNDITTRGLAMGPSRINYNIPKNAQEYYIPITILEGEGEVEISTYPVKNTELNINNIELVAAYDVMYQYCSASQKEPNQNELYVENNKENRIILKNAKAIQINNVKANIISMVEKEEEIVLEIDKDAKPFAYPNFFEVIK